MARVKISGAEFPLKKIFSDDFVFTIPRYQRPYSWTTEQAGELLDDLLASLDGSQHPVEDLDPYFLGSIVLIKDETAPEAEVVDGQQRLTTLTILLAALAHLVENPAERESLRGYIYEKGNAIEEIPDRPRLTLRDRDRAFFAHYVQTDGSLDDLIALDPGQRTDPERNIQANAALFVDRLAEADQERLKRLSKFLLLNCYLVAVGTPDLASAYRIFSVLNERGLDLSHADILKAEIIGEIDEADQEAYTQRWEDAEESLGRDGFSDLFTHVRMIYAKRKMRENLLREFRAVVLNNEPDSKHVIDEVIVPYADAYQSVLNEAFETAGDAVAINRLLHWLGHIDNADWVPPAMRMLVEHQNSPEEVMYFLRDLDRLASSMQIRGLYVNPRIERYGRLLEAIDRGVDLYADDSPLQLTEEEIDDTRSRLNGPIYQSGSAKYVLLRLDDAISSGGASYDYPLISVEHVLPQGMNPDSQWAKDFDEVDHELWVHRLGNLVLLTRRKNSQAQNYDFKEKKAKYFSTVGGITPFAITTQVIQADDWTLGRLEQRQTDAITKLADLWRL